MKAFTAKLEKFVTAIYNPDLETYFSNQCEIQIPILMAEVAVY